MSLKSIPVLILIWTILGYSCGNSVEENQTLSFTQWVGTWNTAPQLVEPRNMPPEPGLSNNTLRQVVRVSIGGDSLRVRLSNEFTNESVTIQSANIALSLGDSKIDTTTLLPLTFEGRTSVTMDSGALITSDPFKFDLKARTDVALTVYFGETSQNLTGHPGSRTTSFIVEGDVSTSAELSEAVKADRWYVINGIDVKVADSAASIVILGNSITDGRGSGTNKQNRWPDILSERLVNNPSTSHLSVLNQGIGGNCVLKFCLGPSALDRFDRDVKRQAGAKWLIILEGVNDLGGTKSAEEADMVADGLISAYQQMIDSAHSIDIKVYGGTILPITKSFYYQDFRETARQKVNEWIRTSGKFDAVIDFDLTMRNPEDTLVIGSDLHDGDFLHPNEKGYQRMGESIDLSLFQ